MNCKLCGKELKSGFTVCGECIKTVEKQPPRAHGHWIDDHTNIVCSVCKEEFSDEIIYMRFSQKPLQYCPNCGAKMEDDPA